MKKLLLFSLITLLSSCAVFAVDMYPAEFVNKFSTCSPYTMSDFMGTRQIKGWNAGKCRYIEKDTFGGVTNCAFSKNQVSELTNAMKNDRSTHTPLKIKYSDGSEYEFNTGSVSTNLWSKYLNMPGVCKNSM